MNDFIYPVDQFANCEGIEDQNEILTCCDDLAKDDKNLAYDCKQALATPDDCGTEAQCKEKLAEAIVKVEAEVEKEKNNEASDDDDDSISTGIIVLIVILPLLFLIAVIIAIVICLKKKKNQN